MTIEPLLAYIHFVGIFTLISCLVLEVVLIKSKVNLQEMILLARADIWYGISSLVVLTSGGLRLFGFGKGSDYYLHNPLFIIKLVLFAFVGIISIYPTLKIIRWRRQMENESLEELTLPVYSQIKKMIIIEILFVLSIPILAILVARGIGIS